MEIPIEVIKGIAIVLLAFAVYRIVRYIETRMK